ncbi:MAG: Zn-ribbon domain-containing OB-fold protein [Salinirussus sp.]
MSWEPRPIPEITPDSEQYWAAAAEGRLLLSECEDCGLVFHYPRPLCPDCFGETAWVEASGEGEIYTFSVGRSLAGWPEDALPTIVAYVELDEGPRMMTNVIADPDDVEIGTRVEVDFIETDEPDIGIPVFSPSDA